MRRILFSWSLSLDLEETKFSTTAIFASNFSGNCIYPGSLQKHCIPLAWAVVFLCAPAVAPSQSPFQTPSPQSSRSPCQSLLETPPRLWLSSLLGFHTGMLGLPSPLFARVLL